MVEVADVLRRYGSEYLGKFGDKMPSSHRRAFGDILRCRTPALGGHVFECDQCGRLEYSYHSCCNRSCPKCHKNETEAWLRAREKELLPVPYYHVIFTLPHELRAFARLHQKEVYDLLIKCAARSIIKLTADPHYVGGRVGVMAVLHTWGANLSYHLHVHCLVTGGGLSSDGRTWMPARKTYLAPVEALSRLFRESFRRGIKRRFKDIHLPRYVWQKEWVAHSKPAVQGTRTVLNYLARYIHRVAITNSRIISADDGKVTFRYKGSGVSQKKTMTVSAEEFIRRFLQHVLPAGVHKVRYYGLWSPSYRESLSEVQQSLTQSGDDQQVQIEEDIATEVPQSPETRTCRHCETGTLIWIRRLPRQGRAPP
ncbi:MAG: IS91 family transposase [Planctomycetota bacterium]